MTSPRLALIVALLLAPSLNASAAVLLSAGSLTGLGGANNDEVDRWRTTSVIKSFDPDGDNIYGTAGYVLFGTDAVGNANAGTVAISDPLTYDPVGTQATLSSIPSYLVIANAGQNKVANTYGYKQIDDPTQTPGAAVSDVESGAALRDAALGSEQSMVTLTIGPNFPAQGLRIGFFTNNTDNFDGLLRLTQTVGGSASATASLSTNVGLELALHFFDLKGVVEGDVFTMYMQKTNPQPTGGNVNTNVLYGGITMDVIPEPGSATLLMVGALSLAARRRRKG